MRHTISNYKKDESETSNNAVVKSKFHQNLDSSRPKPQRTFAIHDPEKFPNPYANVGGIKC